MIPRLYSKTETTFATYGICPLIDALSCIVTERRNEEFELDMVYAKDSGIEIPKDSNPYLYYANAIMTIAQNAPIVIEDNTNIVGSATYIEARHHVVPFLECYSVSHTTIDFRI